MRSLPSGEQGRFHYSLEFSQLNTKDLADVLQISSRGKALQGSKYAGKRRR